VVSDLVTLTINPISSTDNIKKIPTTYFLTIKNTIPASLSGKTNPLTGATYQVGDRVGNIIPASVAPAYRPKIYAGATETPFLDASD
jgi:hypothetical protein